MKANLTVFAVCVALFAVLSNGCDRLKEKREIKAASVSVILPTHEFPFTLSPSSVTPKSTFGANDEITLYDGVVNWDYEKELRDKGIDPNILKEINIKELKFEIKKPKGLDLTPMQNIRVYAGKDYKLVAQGRAAGIDAVGLNVLQKDLLSILREKAFNLKVTNNGIIPQAPEQLEAVIYVKAEAVIEAYSK